MIDRMTVGQIAHACLLADTTTDALFDIAQEDTTLLQHARDAQTVCDHAWLTYARAVGVIGIYGRRLTDEELAYCREHAHALAQVSTWPGFIPTNEETPF